MCTALGFQGMLSPPLYTPLWQPGGYSKKDFISHVIPIETISRVYQLFDQMIWLYYFDIACLQKDLSQDDECLLIEP